MSVSSRMRDSRVRTASPPGSKSGSRSANKRGQASGGPPKTSRNFDDKQTSKDSDFSPETSQPSRQHPSHSSLPASVTTVRASLLTSRTDVASLNPSVPLTKENLRALGALQHSAETSPNSTSSAPRDYMRKKGSPKKSDRKKTKEDANLHPLNLPPDELRRLSAAMAKAENGTDQMDLENDTHDSITSPIGSPPTSPLRKTPGGFPDTTNGFQLPNGVNGHEEKSPTPPPHKPQPLPKVDPEACKAAGNKFFKAKDYERAIAEYTKAVEAEPSNPTYLSNRSAAYISANKYDAALTDSLQASQLDPSNDKILHRLARIYTSLGRPQDALDTYSKIPNSVSARDTAAAKSAMQAITSAENSINSEDGNANMAIWSLDQAKQTLGYGIPWPRRWQILRSKAYLKMGTVNALGEVQAIATALMRDNPMDAEALSLAGRALYLKDDKPRTGKSDYQRAEDCFRQALSLDPDMSDARNCLRTMKKLDRARNEANSVFRLGKYTEAVQLYTDCLTIDPSNKVTNAKLLGNRATSRIKIKEYDEAAADCDQALKLDPTYTKARKTKAKAIGEGGDWQGAVTMLKALAEENQGDPELAKEVRNAELELKKSKRKDYYKILGVEKDAGESEINRAYKRKALQCHPDKFQGDKRKEEEFKELQEANEVLSDRAKRERYDSGVDLMEPGEGMGGFPGGFGGGMGGIDPEILMNMMGGGGGFGGGRGGGMPQFHFGGMGGHGHGQTGGGFQFN